MIRFSSSLRSEKRMPKFRAKKKTHTATVGKRFARRSIFFWVRARSEEHRAYYIRSPHWVECEELKTLR
jgi:hypothetical protein